jgi:hypothetical protein
MAGALSRGNELPNAFLSMSQWRELLQENILQGGQHFHRSGPNQLLQGKRDTWRNPPG